MKKVLLTGLILICTLASYAQQSDTLKNSIQKKAEAMGHGGNNELKINLLLTVIGMPEISYERIVEDNMGVGLSVFAGLDDSQEYNWGLIPHYRLYFGAKKASGFFIEGNAAIINFRDYYYYIHPAIDYAPGYLPPPTKTSTTSFGLGAAAGAKFLTRNGFLGEAYLGVGRTFGENSSSSIEAYPRIGITIGKRF